MVAAGPALGRLIASFEALLGLEAIPQRSLDGSSTDLCSGSVPALQRPPKSSATFRNCYEAYALNCRGPHWYRGHLHDILGHIILRYLPGFTPQWTICAVYTFHSILSQVLAIRSPYYALCRCRAREHEPDSGTQATAVEPGGCD